MSEYAMLLKYYNENNTVEQTRKSIARKRVIKKIINEVTEGIVITMVTATTFVSFFIIWLIK